MLSIVGCAKSPQQVPFQAQVSTGGIQGGGAAIALVLEDARVNNILGSRGGVYEDTSLISLKGSAIKDIELYLRDRLQKAGFEFGADVVANWSVRLDVLSYEIEKLNTVKEEITVQSRMSIVIEKASSTYENSYSATTSEEVVGLASEAKNVDIINRAINATLRALLNDEGISEFMN